MFPEPDKPSKHTSEKKIKLSLSTYANYLVQSALEILQKYTNYIMKIAIVGDFEIYNSKSLKDFIFESNKGSQVFFVHEEKEAIDRLHNAK